MENWLLWEKSLCSMSLAFEEKNNKSNIRKFIKIDEI